MGLVELSVNFFVTLFALIDPVGNIPIFAAATSSATPAGRRRVAVYIALFITAFLAFFYLTGLAILEFFGISLAAFRIAGGVLLFLLGLDMTRSDFLTTFADAGAATDTSDVRGYARRSFERLIVPFAMPLLIGPGAISAVIIQAGAAAELGYAGVAAGLGAIVAVGLATTISFWLTGPISRALGQVGMAIVVRVLGLILCALAIQFIIAGLGEATTGFISRGVAQPYGP
jgi:multiple antibiotic resistance protein